MNFVAVSKVTFPIELKEKIHNLGIEMLQVAKQQHGFVAIAFHQSLTKNETMMYWQWLTQEDHEACMASQDWNAIMKTSGDIFNLEGVEFSLETYSLLA